jgi:BirA family biotin operon repressor/biotin-[acetyl-CoA-carboxylase] ligase
MITGSPERVGRSQQVLAKFDANTLRVALRDCVIGRDVAVLTDTTSTNDWIAQRTMPETEEGLVVFAERQTAGRGQRGNYWESVAGKGLWFSILLRPKIAPAQAIELTEWAAQSIIETVSEAFSLRPRLKPPNDVYLNEKKLAGVLVEMRAQKNAPHVAVVGIGINVNHRKADFSEALRPRATSIALAVGRDVDRVTFAIALLRKLDSGYGDLRGLYS